MAYQLVPCKYCNSTEVVRYGPQSGRTRFKCKDCGRIFKTDYVYRAYQGLRGVEVDAVTYILLSNFDKFLKHTFLMLIKVIITNLKCNRILWTNLFVI